MAKRFDQIHGINFHNIFYSVAKLGKMNIFFLYCFAYHHGYLEEDIYISVPPGYTKAKPGEVYKLVKSLYSLKQAGKQWNKQLISGFTQSICLFTKALLMGF